MLFVIFSAYVTEVIFSSFTILSDPEGISSGLRQNFFRFFSQKCLIQDAMGSMCEHRCKGGKSTENIGCSHRKR